MHVLKQFFHIARHQPQAEAIRGISGSVRYDQVASRVASLAAQLAAQQIAPGQVIGVALDDDVEWIVALLGVLSTGGVYVPLDASLPEAKLAALVSTAKPDWLLTAPTTMARLASVLRRVDLAPRFASWTRTDLHAATPVDFSASLDTLAYLFFSSGSTGAPKCIGGNLAGVGHFIEWEIGRFDIGVGTRVSQFSRPFFDAYLRDVLAPLCSGGVVCLPDRAQMTDGRWLAGWLQREAIEIVHMVPSLFRQLLVDSPPPLPRLRYVLLAGERVLPADARRWREHYGANTQLVNLYGPTETTMTKLFYVLQAGDEQRAFIPVGVPLPNVGVTLLDEQGQPVHAEQVGEIAIRTPFALMGYYGQAQLTQRSFLSSATQAEQWTGYRTGDYGRVLADGNLEFLGRRDQQVKIRGTRVELGEIENTLNNHDAVRESVVVTQERGADIVLLAYVVGRDAATLSEQTLRDYLRQHLADVLVPARIVVLAAIPRLSNGKVDRRALPTCEPVIDAPFLADSVTTSFIARDQQLLEIFRRVLKRLDIQTSSNFFDAGGDSLLALSLATELEHHFGKRVTLNDVLSHPTPESMARAVASEAADGCVTALNRGGTLAPLWLVHPPGGEVGYYCRLAMNLGANRPAYGLRYPALSGGREFAQIDALVAQYVDEMRAVQPQGPYTLGGLSMGGVLAFAVAQRLVHIGQSVHRVFLLDTDQPYAPPTDGVCRDTLVDVELRAFDSLLQFLAEGFDVPIVASTNALRPEVAAALQLIARHFLGTRPTLTELNRLSSRANGAAEHLYDRFLGAYPHRLSRLVFWLLQPLMESRHLVVLLELLRLLKAVPKELNSREYVAAFRHFRAHVTAIMRYRPTVAPFRLVLVTPARERDVSLASAWQHYSTKPLQVIPTAGNHFTFLTGPHAVNLAAQIEPLLESGG